MGLLDSILGKKNTSTDQQTPPGKVVINEGAISAQTSTQGPSLTPANVPANIPAGGNLSKGATAGEPNGTSQSSQQPAVSQISQNQQDSSFRDKFLQDLGDKGTDQQPTGSPVPTFSETFKQMIGIGKKQKISEQDKIPDIEIPSIPEISAQTQQGIADIKDIIAPPSIEVDFNHMQIGKKYYRTYFAAGYPRFVDANWLSPIINFDYALSISTYYYPVDSNLVLQKLRRKIGEMEATIYSDMEAGKVLDPKTKVALTDAHTLQENIAKGEEKFFHFGLYVTIQANSEAELDKIGKAVEATMAALGITAKPTTLQMEQGFQSSMPTSHDALYLTRNMDTTSLASTFPFVTSELTMSEGIMFGLNKHNKSLVIFDRFQMENANSVVFARSGAGKSYLIKLEALRSLMMGTEIIVIDPEKEYEDLCKALDGDYITFSQDVGSKINPFDIAEYERDEKKDALRNKILTLHSFFNILYGGLNNIEKAILDRGLILTYKEKGITTDPDTQNQEPPLLEDLFKVLQGMAEEEAHNLASRLERFMRGSAAGVFNKPTNIEFSNRFTVFSLRDLQEELRPMAMFMMLDFIWTKIRSQQRKRILIVEEAWYMMQNIDSAKFMYSIAKRARKYFLGITTISQDVEDFLLNDFGRAVVTNSSIQILMKQSTAAIDRIQAVFALSEGEKSFLLNAGIGEGLFFAGTNHVAIQVVSSNQEHLLITTNPLELQEMKRKGIDPLSAGDIEHLSTPFDPTLGVSGAAQEQTDPSTQNSLIEFEKKMKEKKQIEQIQQQTQQMIASSQNPSGPSGTRPTHAAQQIPSIQGQATQTAQSTSSEQQQSPEKGIISPIQATEGFNTPDPQKPKFIQNQTGENPPSS